MITVRYFARYRELLNCDQEQLDYSAQTQTVEDLVTLLASRGERWSDVFSGEQRVLSAVNQDMVQADTVINDGDEVAFFPPVTGG